VRSVLAVVLLCSAAPAFAQAAREKAPPAEVREIPIEVPDPTPVGLTVGWKPALLSIRVHSGSGSKFASDAFQPGRGVARYTFRLREDKPFFGRVELEGGTFETENVGLGSTGWDWSARVLVGAATRITSGVVLIASVGLLTRYEVGRSRVGAPTIGVFGVDSNVELAMRLFPTVTLSVYVEGAITPYPYLAQSDLGDLSNADQVRGRLQLSMDVSRSAALEIGYDFTRWHASFTNSTILSPVDRALIVESREHALTLGLRYKM
jgi:hypothetical protein